MAMPSASHAATSIGTRMRQASSPARRKQDIRAGQNAVAAASMIMRPMRGPSSAEMISAPEKMPNSQLVEMPVSRAIVSASTAGR